MDKLLLFEIKGDYAHFKKYYTTTSPLTFEIPPPPTLAGIISAIIGLDKKEYLNFFSDTSQFKMAVRLLNPVVKIRLTLNYIDTKHHFWRIHNRTQIQTEFLKNPHYRIYFYHSDKTIYDSLKRHLENHTSVYSVSLGLSQLLGNTLYGEEREIELLENDSFIPIHSVIPRWKECINNIQYSMGAEIFSVNYPLHMTPDRIVDERGDILFDRQGKAIVCQPLKAFHVKETGENIVFF
ncbi:MAG: type I-B CRISPR-associated protein Cas5b [Candidatus Marinimicrobia bacterium]|nr:type I-B CRISPR-associated protein Cas5b [Candidatus Neomarinimicrobiota bacterium]